MCSFVLADALHMRDIMFCCSTTEYFSFTYTVTVVTRNNAGIIGGAVGGVVAVIIAIVGILIVLLVLLHLNRGS